MGLGTLLDTWGTDYSEGFFYDIEDSIGCVVPVTVLLATLAVGGSALAASYLKPAPATPEPEKAITRVEPNGFQYPNEIKYANKDRLV